MTLLLAYKQEREESKQERKEKNEKQKNNLRN